MRSLETKSAIRKLILAKRAVMDREEWLSGTNVITDKIISSGPFQQAEAVYTYVDVKNEVGTGRLIEHCFKCNKKVAVPKVNGRQMDFYEITGFEMLKPAAFGLLEPEEEIPAEDPYALLIVPGVAFDRECHRIGYGGGYYDRYLEAHPHVHTIAAAFSFQVLPSIPFETHDFCPQQLITEKGEYTPGS